VKLGGADLVGRPPREIWRLGVGRTFQVTATFASMTVRKNVQMALLSAKGGLLGIWRPAASLHRDEALAILERVGIADLAERACGVLAYGDLKRVELAVALAAAPRLLLMDEPAAGMAPGERLALMALIADLARRERIAVLFTEHDMDVVFAHADRIVVLDRGAVIATGAPQAVRADPLVRRVYLGGGA
jgi:branched-chain amino acid transport system ATP-binding protein